MRTLAILQLGIESLMFASLSRAEGIWDADSAYNVSRNQNVLPLRVDNIEVARIPTLWIRTLVEARNRVQAEAGVYSKLLISDKPVINAYANGAGQNTITVTLKMLAMLQGDEAATAALIGHETAHLYRNHSLKTMAASSVFQILGNLAAQALEAKLQSKGIYSGVGTQVASAGTGLVAAGFSREQEREADDWGTRWIIKLGYEPQGALRLHQKLMAATGDHDSFFASHPPTNERLASIERLIAQYQPSGRTAPQSAGDSTEKYVVVTGGYCNENDDCVRGLSCGNHRCVSSQPSAIATTQRPTPNQPPTAQTSIAQTQIQAVQTASIEIQKGQVGVILTLKPRYNYVIFSGTTAQELPVGGVVKVISAEGVQYTGKIARAVDGYYSATVAGDVSKLSIGDRIEGN